MKRDMDLVREILLGVEASNESPHGWVELKIEGHSNEEVSYHVQLLHESGLLVAQDISSLAKHRFVPKYITWTGHEFLDSVRDPEIWRKTKEGAKSIGSASLEFTWEMAKAYAKHLAKEKLGIEMG